MKSHRQSATSPGSSGSSGLRYWAPQGLAILLALAAALPAWAQLESAVGERIVSFHSDVVVEASGVLHVTETIEVEVAHQLIRHGYDERCLTAALVDMAVKGCLRIEEADGEYTLVSTGGDPKKLSQGERQLASHLLDGKKRVVLKKSASTAKTMKKAIQALRLVLRMQYEGVLFHTNRKWLVPGLLLSLLTLGLALWSTGVEGRVAGGFMALWLSIWSVGTFALVASVLEAWRAVIRPGSGAGQRVVSGAGALFMTLFALPFVAGEVAGSSF